MSTESDEWRDSFDATTLSCRTGIRCVAMLLMVRMLAARDAYDADTLSKESAAAMSVSA